MRADEHFPPLPLVLSLVDTALDRDDAFSAEWPPRRLRLVRTAIEYTIYDLLEFRIRKIRPYYRRFLEQLYAAHPPASITLVSLNYDYIADNSLIAIADQTGWPGLPDYGCDVATAAYRDMPRLGRLLKLHGSLNWMYCPNCHRLDLAIAQSGLKTSKMLSALYSSGAAHLDTRYVDEQGGPCADCGTSLRWILITPTHLKDYRNPHVARVWYETARELRSADRAIFVGYSVPEDDVDVIYLLKRRLAHVEPRAITVVEYATGAASALDRHPVGLRYRALFGDEIDWRPQGFQRWLSVAARSGFAPPRRRRRASTRPTAAR
jgi:hypothetical protein